PSRCPSCPTSFPTRRSSDLKFPDLGLSVLESCPGVQHYRLDRFEPRIAPDQVRDAHGLVVLTPAVTAETLAGAENLLAIGRFGRSEEHTSELQSRENLACRL